MTVEPWYMKVDREAVEALTAVLAKPMAEDREMMSLDTFDPWELFPSLYGSYSSDFDECAIEVLEALHGGQFDGRRDLAAEMLREMFCTAHLCDYGSSPRACFPSTRFAPFIPELIEKWKAYYQLQWGEAYVSPR